MSMSEANFGLWNYVAICCTKQFDLHLVSCLISPNSIFKIPMIIQHIKLLIHWHRDQKSSTEINKTSLNKKFCKLSLISLIEQNDILSHLATLHLYSIILFNSLRFQAGFSLNSTLLIDFIIFKELHKSFLKKKCIKEIYIIYII